MRLHAVDDDFLAAKAEDARKIAGKLGSTVRIGKRAFYDQLQLPLDKAYELTGAVMVENMLNRDTAEGVAAFLDKRKPGQSRFVTQRREADLVRVLSGVMRQDDGETLVTTGTPVSRTWSRMR